MQQRDGKTEDVEPASPLAAVEPQPRRKTAKTSNGTTVDGGVESSDDVETSASPLAVAEPQMKPSPPGVVPDGTVGNGSDDEHLETPPAQPPRSRCRRKISRNAKPSSPSVVGDGGNDEHVETPRAPPPSPSPPPRRRYRSRKPSSPSVVPNTGADSTDDDYMPAPATPPAKRRRRKYRSKVCSQRIVSDSDEAADEPETAEEPEDAPAHIKRPVLRRRWSPEETASLFEAFSEVIESKSMPTGAEIRELATKMRTRTIAQIRTQVHNYISGKIHY